LARLLSTTEYKPIRCATNVDELMHGTPVDPERVLFLISGELRLAESGGNAPVEEVRLLRERYPDARLVVISSACDVDDVIATLKAGANGYILNTMTSDILTKSFDLVMSGETVLPYEFTRALRDRKELKSRNGDLTAPFAGEGDYVGESPRASGASEMRKLSGRETAIMSRLIQGDSNKSIARSVGLAEATVKTHVKAILRKIGVKNRTQAALWAMTNLGTLDALDAAPDRRLQNGSSPKLGSN
jgi:two-component system nitrate/nitrite response regulator NarL